MIPIPTSVVVGAVASVAAFSIGFKVSADLYDSKIQKIRAEQAEVALEAANRNRMIEQLGLELSGIISERNALRNQRRKVVEKVITKKVIEYVQTDVAGQCDIPDEFVRIHDHSASGRVSGTTEAPGTSPASATGITDTEVLEVVTANYDACHEIRDKLISLQEWTTGAYSLGG